mmetsp:Transcript_31694/g.48532  ORF Transcript_31694/g.48532 Transcript_31694/m.48532 type:complete len:96 (-) Transcript_31694:1294-1581(-)
MEVANQNRSANLISFPNNPKDKPPPALHQGSAASSAIYKIEEGMMEGSALSALPRGQAPNEYLEKQEAATLYRSNSYSKMNSEAQPSAPVEEPSI